MGVRKGWRGRFFEDFEVGDVYEHLLGRTVTTTDNVWFTLLTQNTAPTHSHLSKPKLLSEQQVAHSEVNSRFHT